MSSTVPIPADAAHPCSKCGGSLDPVPGTVFVDEGDGSAMVDLACRTCGLQSVHYFTPTDAEYEAEFGHSFDEEQA